MKYLSELTEIEISDAISVVTNSYEEISKGVNGVAKVAKVLSLALDICFDEAIVLLDRIIRLIAKLSNN